MGEFAGVFAGLNLGPINTLLLSAILFFLHRAFTRIEQMEREHLKTLKNLGFIMGHLNLKD